MCIDTQAEPASTFNIPSLSLWAWEQLLCQDVHDRNRDAQVSVPQAWRSLKLATLTGWEQIAAELDDDWVFRYEQLQETRAKKLRKAGQPQNGVFYTPPAVARYLTQQTLGRYLNQMQAQILQAWQNHQTQTVEVLWQTVQQTRVIDPACGTGAFLVEALRLFYDFYCAIGEKEPQLTLPHPAHFVVTNQVAGVDVDPLSVMITEFRLMQWAARLDGEVSPLEIVNLPYLTADTLSLDCETAFRNNNMSSIAANPTRSAKTTDAETRGTWQFILGNPPYVSEVRGQAQRFRDLQSKRTPYYQAKMDLCDGFIAWAIDHLQPGGQLAYVLPAYWTQRSSTATLRTSLWQQGQFIEAWNLDAGQVFKNAPGHHSALLIWQKAQQNSPQIAQKSLSLEASEGELLDQGITNPTARSVQLGVAQHLDQLQSINLRSGWINLESRSSRLLLGAAVELGLLGKLAAMPALLSASEIQQGLVIPQGRLKPMDRARLPEALQANLPPEAGVFVLTSNEIESLQFNDDELALLRLYYRPAGFAAFTGFAQAEPFEQIIYTDVQNRRAIEENPNRYARLRAHLDRFATINTSAFAPYGLHRARQTEWFEDPKKVLAPRQVNMPAFAAVPFSAYVNEGFLSIRTSANPYWLCALLNSDLAWFWFYHQKRKGTRLQIDKEVLTHFPSPADVSESTRHECMMLAEKLAAPDLELPTRTAHSAQLNSLIHQIYELTDQEIHWLENFKAGFSP